MLAHAVIVAGLTVARADESETAEALQTSGWSCELTNEQKVACSGTTSIGAETASAMVQFCDRQATQPCRRVWRLPVAPETEPNRHFLNLAPRFERLYETAAWEQVQVGGHPVARLTGPTWRVAIQVKQEGTLVVEDKLDKTPVVELDETVLQCVEVVQKTRGTTLGISTGTANTSSTSNATISPTVEADIGARGPGAPSATVSGNGTSQTTTTSAGIAHTRTTTREVEVVRYLRFDEAAGTVRIQGVTELQADEDGWSRATLAEFDGTRIVAGFPFKPGVRIANAIGSLGVSEAGPFAGMMVSEVDRVSGKWRVAGHTFTCSVYDEADRRF